MEAHAVRAEAGDSSVEDTGRIVDMPQSPRGWRPGLGHQASGAGLRSEAGLSATDVGHCTREPERAEVGTPLIAGISAPIAQLGQD